MAKDSVIYVPDTTIKKLVASRGFPIEKIIVEKEFGDCGDKLKWKIDRENGTLAISESGEIWGYKQYPDTSWNTLTDDITKVVIGDDVSYIGSLAFKNWIAMTEAVIGTF